jgi:hypothetical protein
MSLDRAALLAEADRLIRQAQEQAADRVREEMGPSPADLLRAWEVEQAAREAADPPATRGATA